MFYDDVFADILADGPFSTEGKLTVDQTQYTVKGIFCSGNYGSKEYDKGYTTKKTEKRQSFKISKLSIPSGLAVGDLLRQPLTIDGKSWIVNEITGNDSGVYELVLKAGANGSS